ncbi:hypothetical protein C8R27_11344 [Nitrosomonas ureae]|uniref:hypothetical protein n=1 Tax=Nitrosomonas ureae TaxID=44577 RepID=UPI000D754C84|nr:hypothetical protein [Nitrosomonas ureae]PXX14760.1 hypothetical protein C8R27_11344 [Nitrosomonas ureae]
MRQTNCKHQCSGIENFVHEVSAESERNIGILKDIELTLSFVNRLAAELHSDTKFAKKLKSDIDKLKFEIDPDNVIVPRYERAQSDVCSIYNELIQKRTAARGNPFLADEVALEESYSTAISAAAELQNSLNDLRWHILEHDADLSPTIKSHSNAEDLIKDLVS